MSKVIPLRLSHSSLSTLLVCERKFQLEKILKTDVARDETEHTSFGKAYGAGIATYLVTQDIDKALYQAWLAYWPQLETDKKSQAICFMALMSSVPHLNRMLEQYEVVSFNGKPAIELSFKINISENYYFVGFLDVVLRDIFTDQHYVMDIKTTGLALLDLDPLYKNSGQVLGYSIALDKIVGEAQASYGVLYFVAQLGRDHRAKIHVLAYQKTLLDRLNWFITLGQDTQRLDIMREIDVYPMRGNNCIQFMRPCKFFGVCNLKSFDEPKDEVEDTTEYDFVYDLDSLIDEHIARVQSKQIKEIA